MPIYRKTEGGVFALISALNVNDGGEFKSVAAAWINDNGTFKKVFPSYTEYEDPSAYYDIANATTLTLTQGNASETTNRLSWIANSVRIPLLSNLDSIGTDVDWSYYDYIVVETGEVVPVDMFSTGSNQPTAIGVKYDSGSSSALIPSTGAYLTLQTSNPTLLDRQTFLGWNASGGYQYFKVQQQDYSSFYGKQLGLRWRWHSTINDKYFEYIFTNENFVLTAL
ncbi:MULTISPECIES: hypothetical protein [Brenneria]|uniref:Uncharacterized protein n=1 Tax=Brenneria nigrifluens DSM 30175 = ATCC 13028 TaxID=1121120 RepID=A0A2U1U8S5_9GAMM|nr:MULTISPECIES: hypothetical protein [Brenneria]EHD21334.1 hypothetical protein BrE312_1945 [Brenneria sp. EniD312]EHD21764.1 hypothetical protein BrE312_2384 [Brenneria sp. EniD312]PWC18075.1 hypothetical protein DDT54_22950 [Brenneria nigrifluens DSM 30175 = ATCC 13028]QCR04466.1 hypothetical protein EH206_09960 [Brenneria nigrifluens DSM 30175 = ATCC 13028]QCR04875.1 hypothetical protein EH206_12205 [Brenneria nigrifluens DSM 30175 = ATCC 13028]